MRCLFIVARLEHVWLVAGPLGFDRNTLGEFSSFFSGYFSEDGGLGRRFPPNLLAPWTLTQARSRRVEALDFGFTFHIAIRSPPLSCWAGWTGMGLVIQFAAKSSRNSAYPWEVVKKSFFQMADAAERQGRSTPHPHQFP